MLYIFFQFLSFIRGESFDQFFSVKFGYGETFTDSAVLSLPFQQETSLFSVLNQEEFQCVRKSISGIF